MFISPLQFILSPTLLRYFIPFLNSHIWKKKLQFIHIVNGDGSKTAKS